MSFHTAPCSAPTSAAVGVPPHPLPLSLTNLAVHDRSHQEWVGALLDGAQRRRPSGTHVCTCR